MPSYTYEDDGRIHTRFSELKNCTEGSIGRVIQARLFPEERYEGTLMTVGSLRHAEFADEIARTGKIPAVFQDLVGPLAVDGSEEGFACEILPGVVLHSTVDAYGRDDYIADFKTVSAGVHPVTGEWVQKKPPKNRQTTIYSIQMALNGIGCNRSLYLFEYWSPDRSEVVGYGKQELGITQDMKDEAMQWIATRVDTLKQGLLYIDSLPGAMV